ncbi:MAG TPA: response regulator [Candidatus Acidoferrum sp.]|jgi:two-component system cell cycle response regulator DivK|nr:response regulator [Candidatus Acidoferrum sp.]
MKRRILVVEDNAANLELLVDWLESEDFQVQTATTLDEAFAAFKGEPPETVLLDVQLGPQDGLALATWIRGEPNLRALPVIAVTAHAMLTDYERVMRAGCSACVSKPIDFRQLREQLGRWLGEPAKSHPGG